METLVGSLDEAEGNIAYERGPTTEGAEGACNIMAAGERVEVEDVSMGFVLKAVTVAALEAVGRELLVGTDEECYLFIGEKGFDATHTLMILLQRIEETAIMPGGIVTTTDMETYQHRVV